MNSNPAPPKPPTDLADHKAVSAYFSELRRYAKALEHWEAGLDKRETELAGEIIEFERWQKFETRETHQSPCYPGGSNLMDEGCGIDCGDCDDKDAEAGCDCPKCVDWRSRRAVAMIERQQEAVAIGDEVQWLEDLFKLKDKRRKRSARGR